MTAQSQVRLNSRSIAVNHSALESASHDIEVEHIHVVFCASANYFQHTATAAVSLARSHRSSHITIHVISCDDDVSAWKRLQASLIEYPWITTIRTIVSDTDIENLSSDEKITKETYLRILIPKIISPDIRRVVYLDSDLIVTSDIGPLWGADLRGRAVGAVSDMLGLLGKRSPSYVNAGVLVLDLDRWRRDDLTGAILTFARRHNGELEYYDQDAINLVLGNDITHLDFRWNVPTYLYRWPNSFPKEHFATFEAARRDPAIIHYVSHKPWVFRSETLRRRDYFRNQRLTRWKGEVPALKPLHRIEYRIDRALTSVGIDRTWLSYQSGRVIGRIGRSLPSFLRRGPVAE